MGLFEKKKSLPDPETGSAPSAVGARGEYTIDEHILSPIEIAERFGTVVDWKNIGGSQGLTSQQVSWLLHHAAAGTGTAVHLLRAAGSGVAKQVWPQPALSTQADTRDCQVPAAGWSCVLCIHQLPIPAVDVSCLWLLTAGKQVVSLQHARCGWLTVSFVLCTCYSSQTL